MQCRRKNKVEGLEGFCFFLSLEYKADVKEVEREFWCVKILEFWQEEILH